MGKEVISELLSKIEPILGKIVDNVDPSNDGGPGDTMEFLLGVKINNLKLPDYGGTVEIKTGKLSSGSNKQSYLTLFHRNPLPTPNFDIATNALLLTTMGWNHSGLCNPRTNGKPCKGKKINGHIKEANELYKNGIDGFGKSTGRCYPIGERSFRSTTYFTKTGYKGGKRASDRGLYLDIAGDFLIMGFDPKSVNLNKKSKDTIGHKLGHTYQDWFDEISKRSKPNYREVFPVKYKIEDLYQDYVNKLSNALFCTYKTKGNSKKQIMFMEAYLLGDPVSIKEFKSLLVKGSLVIDFDQRSTHDHGTKLRLRPDSIGDLFNKYERVSFDQKKPLN